MTNNMHKAPRVTLIPNMDKILDAVCYVIFEAKNRNSELTQYDIVKTLFLADKAHLNKYGRPITFDNYFAMNHGPVPTTTYDLLKENKRTLNKHDIDVLPWKRTKKEGHNHYKYSLKSRKTPDFESLSQSDKDALKNALITVKSLTFGQIRKLTHEDSAYEEAWDEDNPAQKSHRMSYGMLFESPNFEAAEHIEFLSKHQ